MKNFKFLTLAGLCLLFSLQSCEKDSVSEDMSNLDEDIIINMNNLENRTLVTDSDVLDAIRSLDIDVGIVSIGDFHLPDGTIEERIYIGSDITFTREELNALMGIGSNLERQYRTFNLVTGNNQSINILGYTGGSQALSSKAQTALTRAVANYLSLIHI